MTFLFLVKGANERGDRLNQLSEKTGQLEQGAKTFLDLAREINEKEAKKKWYEL